MADNKKYYYLKLKENFFESDEAIILESMPDGYIYSNILLKLYLRSLKNDGLLMFNNLIPYNAQMLATITRHQVGTVEKAIQIFRDLQLIEILDNGAIYMTNIQNFVGKSSTEADRIRKLRAKNNSGVQMLNKCTPEIEKDKKIDINIDIKSEVEEEIKDSSSAADEKSDFNIFEYYQSRIGVLDGYQAEKLNAYLQVDKLERKLVKRAIDRAADNSKRSFGYINSILKSWAQNGITTIAQQDEEQRQFQSRKSKQEEEVSEYDTW
ncbi:TPA: phage replisome organizer N-terminal domain-containing protein [Streptococcus pyogenes]|uniref:phage replisome organizer N-terminal domain-containing protein n=1 Tax=Streptococcus pyogenes TaxID=1314 RepID=UPI00109C150F|nr:phage replisome organizer N-terminal domain-containing protein [Streptococcus pyogenes]QCK44276.1 DnaD domain protein [Streptococcus pyogenes]VHG19985.1 primosome component and related proteins [Streptococcus pyogenes]VHK26145.1 primosome component and related proteins [Streptococcus pyogenes]HEP1482191.1 phage replisome organizer N-terminal domain-containing protein [Streptococcus pyogenes]HEP1679826.1 phage replisome organizer N-terminal domain-containing protein [Streptococcus pyogenes]